MKKIIIIIPILAFLTGCNSLDDVEPIYTLDDDKAIFDEASAQIVLNGVYNELRDGERATFITGASLANSMMGLSNNGGLSGNPLVANNPQINAEEIEGLYLGAYRIIQEANLFIERVEVLEANAFGNDAIKNNFLAEGRFLRGLAHFYLLRSFGQFYDTSSLYGISLKLEPSYNATPTSRNSVSESYAAIYADLDFAIENCFLSESYYANKDAAKAIKAKVLLYEGEYEKAASLAKEIIDTTSRTFTDNYSDNFGKNFPAHESSALFFGPFFNTNEAVNRAFSSGGTLGTIYESIARPNPNNSSTWDPRAGQELFPGVSVPFNKGTTIDFTKFPTIVFTLPTHIHMRLAEIYLIHAEAAARIGVDVDLEALASLNEVRTRPAVDLPPLLIGVDVSSKAELLEAIRIEKLLELYFENGEDFFDLIRYDINGNIDPSTVKPTMNNVDKYIFPIPWIELQVQGSEDIIIQNPGYPITL
ncbi:RagB/SusD family nutrient uptake outer membrane protein [uncultured Polaribacter sp.]|uniref:RagB/SusD family nutrient uptake outer membrane protein n=1 Tax=uncultured Polaribacter sp. TaxID=174711 RepID=UPI002622728B|nr:RagB/SusD family nutrient uptake outer membrane protein [uncultured Polaribacter sp.]